MDSKQNNKAVVVENLEGDSVTHAVNRVSFRRGQGGNLRIPWSQRRRQVHHDPNALRPSRSTGGSGTVAGFNIHTQSEKISTARETASRYL